jgi:hypothetical protein
LAPLNFKYDAISDVMTIEGNRFSGDFFRYFNMTSPQAVFRIVEIANGNITIEKVLEGSAQIVEYPDRAKSRIGR